MNGAAEGASPESIQYRRAVATAEFDDRIKRILIGTEDQVCQAGAVEVRLLVANEYVGVVQKADCRAGLADWLQTWWPEERVSRVR